MPAKSKFALLLVLLIPCWVIAVKYDVDLLVMHNTTRLVHFGDYASIYNQKNVIGRYFYGPISLVVFNPIGLFSYPIAKGIWIALQTVSFVLFWVFLTRLYPILNQPTTRWGWILIWIVSINPLHNNFQSNNIQLMLATVLLGAELCTQSAKPARQWWGGVLCALAALIKLFPLFLLAYYFVGKSRAVRWGTVCGSLLWLGLPFLYFGFDNGVLIYRDFFVNLSTYGADNKLSISSDILCLPTLLVRWFNLDQHPRLEPWIVKGSVLTISILFFLYIWKNRAASAARDRSSVHLWAMASALMVFLNPSSRPHYFLFYIPAFASCLEILYQETRRGVLTAVVLVSTVLIAFTAEGVLGKHLNNQVEQWSIPTVGMALLCLGLAYGISRSSARIAPRLQ